MPPEEKKKLERNFIFFFGAYVTLPVKFNRLRSSSRRFLVILEDNGSRCVLRCRFLSITFRSSTMCVFISAFTVAGTGIQPGLELSNGCPYFTADVCASALFLLCVLFSAWQQLPRKQRERFHRCVCLLVLLKKQFFSSTKFKSERLF